MKKYIGESKDTAVGVDAELDAIQPKTYWEQRCYATEQFVEMFFSIIIPNMNRGDQELARHLIAEYQRSIARINPLPLCRGCGSELDHINGLCKKCAEDTYSDREH